VRHFRRRHRRLQFQLRQVDHREQTGVDRSLVAALQGALGNAAGDRRAHQRVVERLARQRELGLGRAHLALGDVGVGLVVLIGGLGDELLRQQLLVLAARLLGELRLGAAGLERRHALVQAGAVFGLVDARQQLAGLDRVALLDQHLGQLAGDLGLDHRLRGGAQGAGERQQALDLAGLGGRQVIRRQLDRRLGGLLLGRRRGGPALGHDGGSRQDRDGQQGRHPFCSFVHPALPCVDGTSLRRPRSVISRYSRR